MPIHPVRLAQELLPKNFGSSDSNVQSYEYIYSQLQHIGSLAMSFVFSVALIALLITGYNLITSFGDEAKLTQAKTSFLYIVIGILFVLCAFLVVKTVGPMFVPLGEVAP